MQHTLSIAEQMQGVRARLRAARGDRSLREFQQLIEHLTGYRTAFSSIYHWEAKDREVPVEYVLAVALATRKNPSWILFGHEPENLDLAARQGEVLGGLDRLADRWRKIGGT